MIKTLEDACSKVKQFFYANDYKAALSLLSGVREFIRQINDIIVKLTDGQQTVNLLSQIHEMIEGLSERINNCIKGGYKSEDGFIETWYECCIKIKNIAECELKPDKIEIVFFPYKASMWDCFESVWLAAKEDPECDVYVVPIPYYDFTSNRTSGQMYYEGDRYPDYVKITSWEKYDVKARRPDVIFIHNPYDEGNIVTRVHPSFFSKRLMNFTNMLVYVPYFVALGKTSKQFCLCAGTIYADKVILQSEVDRQNYIDVLGEWVKESGIGSNHPLWHKLSNIEDKFIVLGSPKFDKAKNLSSSDLQVPVEWLNLIESPQKRKSVILYNTRFTDMSNGIENKISKLKSVLNAFKEQDELLLLWRPHPLSIASLQSMAPHFLKDYMSIVDEYKNAGWGIYDDTEDLHRSIALSDGYYGDGSSLIPLYIAAGKPIVIQDNLWTGDGARVRFGDFVQDSDGRCWAFELHRDGLFELDFNTNTTRFVARSRCFPTLQKKKYLIRPRYIKIHAIGDKIICIPFYLDNIMIYSKITDKTEFISLDRAYLDSPDTDGFIIYYSVEYKGKIYCFSNAASAVIVFDSRDNSVKYDTKIFNQEELWKKNENIMIPHPYISDASDSGKVTLLLKGCEHLIRYSLLTEHLEILSSNINISKCLYATFDGLHYWLINESGNELLRWNPDTDELSRYIIPENRVNASVKDFVYTGIVNFQNMLLLIPGFGNKVLKFDKPTKQFSEHSDLPVPIDFNNSILKYGSQKLIDDKQYLFSRYNSMVYKLGKDGDIVTEHLFKIDDKSIEPFFGENYNKMSISDECSDVNFYEHSVGDVIKFLTAFAQSRAEHWSNVSNLSRFAVNADGTAGEAIYKYVKSLIITTPN